MRYTTLGCALVASVMSGNALDLPKVNGQEVPQCAITCFATGILLSGCDLSDTKCQCTKGLKPIKTSLTECLPKNCSEDEINNKVIPGVIYECQKVGIDITDSIDVPTYLQLSRRATVDDTNTDDEGTDNDNNKDDGKDKTTITGTSTSTNTVEVSATTSSTTLSTTSTGQPVSAAAGGSGGSGLAAAAVAAFVATVW